MCKSQVVLALSLIIYPIIYEIRVLASALFNAESPMPTILLGHERHSKNAVEWRWSGMRE